MRKKLLKKITDGSHALHYDNGNLKQLRKVLRKCFPEDDGGASGVYIYFFKEDSSIGFWDCSHETNLPTIKLSKIFKPKKKEEYYPFENFIKMLEKLSLSIGEIGKKLSIDSGHNRIKSPDSNKIADFVQDYLGGDKESEHTSSDVSVEYFGWIMQDLKDGFCYMDYSDEDGLLSEDIKLAKITKYKGIDLPVIEKI